MPEAASDNNYASYRVVNAVREKISTEYVRASDTDVAKALKVSRARFQPISTAVIA